VIYDAAIMLRAAAVGIVFALATSAWAWSSLDPDPLAFHAVALAAIGTVYAGFGLTDGRMGIAALEVVVATAFMVLAFAGLWLAPVLAGVGLALHGVWDLAHGPHRITTRLPSWYPPFCAAYDFAFAGVFFWYAARLAA
jgi:hypothetical protein